MAPPHPATSPIDPWRTTPLSHPVVVVTLLVVMLGPIAWTACSTASRGDAEVRDVESTLLVATGPMLLDVNDADPELLGVLPGIGPTMAARIVEHRRRFGPFVRPEDLMEVRGIGPKTFAQFQRHAVVLSPITLQPGGQTLAADLP